MSPYFVYSISPIFLIELNEVIEYTDTTNLGTVKNDIMKAQLKLGVELI